MLARKVVTRRGRHFRGYFPSRKLNRMVAWESPLERDAIQLLEFSPGVVSYQEQPTVIQYFDGDQMRDYYPDLEVRLLDGATVHFEVKPSSKLAKPKIATKLRAIAEHYIERGWRFRIITEHEIRCEPLLSNVRTLIYLNGRAGTFLPTAADLIRTFGSTSVSFDALAAKLGKETVWRLLAVNQLACDLTQPITANTLLSTTMGGRDATVLL